ncbi:MAG: hypothetical protein KBD76_08200 [Bacteriovorax sp.]|nr:hypothetical protein [Bacteriovorax sp.]
MKGSSSNTNTTIAYWETPIVDHRFLWLAQQAYTGLNNYFFFENDIETPANPIYVMTIGAGETFKISDESDSSLRIDQLLQNRPSSLRERARSFKIWNSPLALEASYTLGMTSKEYDEIEKFQFLIITQDETIEFLTLKEPTWEIYEGVKLEDLVIQYIKRDFQN